MHMAIAQSTATKLNETVKKLLDDPQLKHGVLSLYVVNSVTGKTVYDLNGQMGLAPASCQKIFTSITAMELLGHDYRYKTELGYNGTIKKDVLNGNLHLLGYGDPSLGSWRFADTKDSVILNNWITAIKNLGIKKIAGSIYADNYGFTYQPLPGGWIWDDIGNYYGAGTWALNWHENQYDLSIQPGKQVGFPAEIISIHPSMDNFTLVNQIRTGNAGSGDNTYIYSAPYATKGFVTGTVPLQDKPFVVSGAMPSPSETLISAFRKELVTNKIKLEPVNNYEAAVDTLNYLNREGIKTFYTGYSPTLDSLNYWFLKKSINLYGETLLKTIALEKSGVGDIDSGLTIIKRFWEERGIDKASFHIMDGSGLSPQNRVTTFSLVTALQYARTRPWFNSFYFALPEYNQMKLKSGSIGGARSFAGYHTAKDGTAYTLAIITNNFDGSANEMVKKMFIVLDQLQ